MKGFEMQDGDIVIENNEIQIAEDIDFKAQTLRNVAMTNKGEWMFDESEGITFANFLGQKYPMNDGKENPLRYELEQAGEQVDSSLTLEEFTSKYDKYARTLKSSATYKMSSGETVTINTQY